MLCIILVPIAGLAGTALGMFLQRKLRGLSALERKLQYLAHDTEFAVRQIEDKFRRETGEYKNSQAIRMLQNIHPKAKLRALKASIELVLERIHL